MTLIAVNPTSRGEIWQGDFSPAGGPITAAGSTQYPNPPSFETPTRVQVLTDTPPPGLKQYARFTVQDADLSGAANPRCQLVPPFVAWTNQILRFRGWLRMSYVPPVTGSQFFNLMEIYGPPYAASPTISLTIDKNGNVAFASNQQATSPYYFNGMWTRALAPLLNTWMHFSIVAKFSTDNTIGYTEFSFASDGTDNDVLQSLTIGGTTNTHMPMCTLDYNPALGLKGKGTHATMYAQLYRSRGLEATSTLDLAGFRIDTLN